MTLCRSTKIFIFAAFATYSGVAAHSMETPPVSAPSAPINSVLVAVPDDGRFNGRTYFGSGHFVAYRTVREFGQFAQKVDIAPPDIKDRGALLDIARRANDAYLVVPVIVRWEYRVEGVPSYAGINVTIVNVDSGGVVLSTLLEGETPPNFLRQTNPDMVAISLVHDYVAHLYGRQVY